MPATHRDLVDSAGRALVRAPEEAVAGLAGRYLAVTRGLARGEAAQVWPKV